MRNIKCKMIDEAKRKYYRTKIITSSNDSKKLAKAVSKLKKNL